MMLACIHPCFVAFSDQCCLPFKWPLLVYFLACSQRPMLTALRGLLLGPSRLIYEDRWCSHWCRSRRLPLVCWIVVRCCLVGIAQSASCISDTFYEWYSLLLYSYIFQCSVFWNVYIVLKEFFMYCELSVFYRIFS